MKSSDPVFLLIVAALTASAASAHPSAGPRPEWMALRGGASSGTHPDLWELSCANGDESDETAAEFFRVQVVEGPLGARYARIAVDGETYESSVAFASDGRSESRSRSDLLLRYEIDALLSIDVRVAETGARGELAGDGETEILFGGKVLRKTALACRIRVPLPEWPRSAGAPAGKNE